MIVFYALVLLPISIQFIGDALKLNHKKTSKFSLTIFFVILTLLLILRHKTVGNDTSNYHYLFLHTADLSWGQVFSTEVEIGFQIYMKLISLITKDVQIYLAFTALLTVAMIYPTYNRLCEDAILTMVLYCTMSTFVLMFSGIRQMLAIAMGIRAYEFTRNKKIIFYLLIVAVAITFHTSAIMLLFMYPLYHTKITKKWLYVVVPLFIVLFIFNRQIFSFLSGILAEYTKYNGMIQTTGAYTMILLFLIFVVFSFIIPNESWLDQETIGLRNFLLLSLILQMFAPLHSLAMRMNYYYIIFIPLLIPKVISFKSKQWGQVAVLGKYVMIIFFLVYFFQNAYTSNSSLHVFPYHFFWENVL